jgi:hypothetical protein
MTDAYAMDVRVVVSRDPAEFNIARASETLQLWHVRLSHQDKRHVRKVLVWMEINMSMVETGDFCDGCFWVNRIGSLSLNCRIDHRSSVS